MSVVMLSFEQGKHAWTRSAANTECYKHISFIVACSAIVLSWRLTYFVIWIR
jgi:hypothetical protein